MNIEGTGEVLTPVDDPCEYDAAWRFSLASYLFSVGVRSKDDFICLGDNGGIMVAAQEPPKQAERHKTKGKKAKQGKTKKPAAKKVMCPVAPFSEHPEYRSLASDEWVQKMVFMMSEEAAGRQISEDYRPIKMAMRWYGQNDSEAAMKKRLEPLLLTDANLDVITLDLIGSLQNRAIIKAYERLFFSSRDDDFNLHPSIQRIQKLAMPWGPLNLGADECKDPDASVVEGDRRPRAKASDLWRVVAADLGYDALMTIWKWNAKAHGLTDGSAKDMLELPQIVITILLNNTFESLCAGTIGHKDAAKMLSSYATTQLKLMEARRKNGGNGELDDATKALMAILKAAAPKMYIPEEGSPGMITDDMIRERIAAQQAIDNQPIEDAGKHVVHEVIDAQILGKIKG